MELVLIIFVVGTFLIHSFALFYLNNKICKQTIQISRLMATQELFEAQLQRFNEETNRISAILNDLKSQIEGQGLSSTLEEAILQRLTAAADALAAVGSTPVPPVEEDEDEDNGEPVTDESL